MLTEINPDVLLVECIAWLLCAVKLHALRCLLCYISDSLLAGFSSLSGQLSHLVTWLRHFSLVQLYMKVPAVGTSVTLNFMT